ncbi:hypothetical protein SCMU_24020 [Sinomonas cyclohexanicum]|uniref:Thiamine-monophosphate kinase n=1 Tax=Sinomonas cyclohexanicum TaxID=322009 RepID=A0ABN6FI98_SINCY|nr:hypothetical protein [Corynebacterium cyclohexanicum]BCT76560.1 hypothetical protein SCMU_24020 [Corynebacterium cyclohexanicum]
MTVTVLGTLAGRAPVLRSGAREGDVVAVAGRLGTAAAGLSLLEHGPRYGQLGAALRGVVQSHCRPVPPLAAGPLAARSGASALMDLSDGLLRDGDRMGRASGVVLDLDESALGAYATLLAEPAVLLGADALAWVLGGGEDHGLLATFPSTSQLPDGFTAIGSVVPPAGGPGGVAVAGRPAQPSGWDHFAR